MGHRPSIDWSAVPLGREPDAVIAAQLGVSDSAVQQQRSKRGIPSHHASRFAWDTAPLGLVTDAEVAGMLGIHPDVVRKARKRRGIPSRSPQPRPMFDHEAKILQALKTHNRLTTTKLARLIDRNREAVRRVLWRMWEALLVDRHDDSPATWSLRTPRWRSVGVHAAPCRDRALDPDEPRPPHPMYEPDPRPRDRARATTVDAPATAVADLIAEEWIVVNDSGVVRAISVGRRT
jgi:hypothetical protein